jgi:HEAT repeat protein
MKIVAIIIIASCMTALADFTPLAPKVDPLPEAEVGILFVKFDKGEKTDLPKLYQALNGPQTTLRAYAARELGKYGNTSSIPFLIDALSDESMHVGANYIERGMATTRYWANDSLRKLTGKDCGFIWNDPIEKRNQAITRWREWFQKEMKTEPAGGAYVLPEAVKTSAHP